MEKLRYNYYWYHHRMNISTRECVEDYIMDKDFNGFMKIFNDPRYATNFPTDMAVFKGYDLIDHLDIRNKDNFNLITYTESENG